MPYVRRSRRDRVRVRPAGRVQLPPSYRTGSPIPAASMSGPRSNLRRRPRSPAVRPRGEPCRRLPANARGRSVAGREDHGMTGWKSAPPPPKSATTPPSRPLANHPSAETFCPLNDRVHRRPTGGSSGDQDDPLPGVGSDGETPSRSCCLSRWRSYSMVRAAMPLMVHSCESTSVKQIAMIAVHRSSLVCGYAGSRIDAPLPYLDRALVALTVLTRGVSCAFTLNHGPFDRPIHRT